VDVKSNQSIDIRDNYLAVLERIGKAARKAGRKPEDIRLVVVTKTHPIELIQTIIDAGAQDLGENYVEEAIPKILGLLSNENIRWHMIGHVQSRKAEDVCRNFQFLHSLDSFKLAQRLDRVANELDLVFPVWLEFNLSGESTKSGWDMQLEDLWPNFLPVMEKLLGLSHLKILGAMTMPPYSEDPEFARPFYRQLRKFQEFIIKSLRLEEMRELSIGMSSDFEVAIEEGSTCIRVGQAIMGPRRI
jgi:PLP dependent protein